MDRRWEVDLARAEAALLLAARRAREGGQQIWKVAVPGSCTRRQLAEAADLLAVALAEEIGQTPGFVLAVKPRATAERPSVDRSATADYEAAESKARSLRLIGFEVRVRAPNSLAADGRRALTMSVDGVRRTVEGPTPFGRSDAAGVLSVGGRNVSWIHGAFLPTSGGWSVYDADSTNGTTLNGRRVGSSPVAIRPGDVISLASGSPGGCDMKVMEI